MAKINLNNIDLTKVEPRPVIRDSTSEVVLEKLEIKPGKTNPSGQVMHLQMKTLNAHTSTKDTPVAPGRTLFHYVAITPTEKYGEDRIAEALVELQLGFLGEKLSGFDTEDIIGKTATVKLGIETSTERGEQNKIVGFVVKSA